MLFAGYGFICYLCKTVGFIVIRLRPRLGHRCFDGKSRQVFINLNHI